MWDILNIYVVVDSQNWPKYLYNSLLICKKYIHIYIKNLPWPALSPSPMSSLPSWRCEIDDDKDVNDRDGINE